MADERLRELERRFKETGSLEDEVAYLKARLRSAEVSRERVELSALDDFEVFDLLEAVEADIRRRGIADLARVIMRLDPNLGARIGRVETLGDLLVMVPKQLDERFGIGLAELATLSAAVQEAGFPEPLAWRQTDSQGSA